MFAAIAQSWLELEVENSQVLLDTCSDLSQPYRFASRIVDYGPRYRREEYALMREIMDDGETLPLSFDEWEKNAESERAVAKREGVSIIPVLFAPDEFSRSAKRRKSHPTARPPQHSPVAEGRRASLCVCD